MHAEPAQSPPTFLRLLADPLRWRLLRELAVSDRRVRELCLLLDRPQNLVSYHLGQLRSEGVVSRRRSAADGRDSYYSLDLARCGELLARGGAALHPGLAMAVDSRPADSSPRRRDGDASVLFLCTGNSGRSQMAEALAVQLAEGAIRAASAGSHPKPVHPDAVVAMRARGIDLTDARSKHLSEFAGQRFDYVITLCDRVREVCPAFDGAPTLVHWSIPDPAREAGEGGTAAAFERVAVELSDRVSFFIDAVADRPPKTKGPTRV